MKKTYNVALPVVASIIFTVEAESEEEAIRIAKKKNNPTLCPDCSDHLDIESRTTDYDPEVWEVID
jgi:hypothetical protein